MEVRAIGHLESPADGSATVTDWASKEARVVIDPALLAGLEGLEWDGGILVA